jgi:nucleoid-associated protein YgaU
LAAVDSLGTGFDALLARGALGVLVLAAGWAILVVLAVALEARTGGRVRLAERAGCPPRLRLWLLAAFVAVFGWVAPAHASDTGSGDASTRTAAALDGLPLPDRTTDASTRVVLVGPGDSLWRIARRLHPHADDRELARTVAVLYAANRSGIGPDPDHLQPGQRLLVDRPDTLPEAP